MPCVSSLETLLTERRHRRDAGQPWKSHGFFVSDGEFGQSRAGSSCGPRSSGRLSLQCPPPLAASSLWPWRWSGGGGACRCLQGDLGLDLPECRPRLHWPRCLPSQIQNFQMAGKEPSIANTSQCSQPLAPVTGCRGAGEWQQLASVCSAHSAKALGSRASAARRSAALPTPGARKLDSKVRRMFCLLQKGPPAL